MKGWISSVGLLALVTGCGATTTVNTTSGATPGASNVVANTASSLPTSSTIDFKLSGTVSANGETMSPSITSTSASTVQTGGSVYFVDPQVKDAVSLIQVVVYENGKQISTLTPKMLLQNNGCELMSAGTYKFVISASGVSGSSTSATIDAVGNPPKPFQLSFASKLDSNIHVAVSNYSQPGDTMKISYSGVPSAYSLEGSYYTSVGGGFGISDFKIEPLAGNSTRHPLSFFIPEVLSHNRFKIVLTFMNPQGNILVAESSVLQTG